MPVKKLVTLFFCLVIVILTESAGLIYAANTPKMDSENKSLILTIYHNGALFDHKAKISVKRGRNQITFGNICPGIIPGSVFIKVPQGLIERYSYSYTPPTSKRLLQLFRGEKILLRDQKNCNKGKHTVATLLSYNDNKVMVKTALGIFETDISKIIFPSLPQDISLTPEIRTTLFFKKSDRIPVELLYLSQKLGWQANYTGFLTQDEKKIAVQAFALLQNHSQLNITGANVRLVAGKVKFQYGSNVPVERMYKAKAMPAAPVSPLEEAVRERLFEYYIYEIPQSVNLAPLRSQNIRLFNAGSLPCNKKLIFQSNTSYYYRSVDSTQKRLNPDIILEIDTKGQDRKLPFPAGNFRVYKADSKGTPIFVGQQRIQSVAPGAKIILNIGKAFDITCKKRQLTFNRIKTNNRYIYSYESTYELQVRNSKDEPVTVFIREEIPGQWSVTAENLPHIKEDARHCLWKMQIPASGTSTLKYSVRILD